MAFPIKSQPVLQQDLVDGLRSSIDGLDTSSTSDAWLKAGALAHVIEGLYSQLSWVEDQAFPDSASPENLERHAALVGTSRKAPNEAEGTAQFTGVDGTPIAAGTLFTKSDGWEYETTALATWDGGGTATAPAIATSGGADGNCTAGEVLTLSTPIANVDSIGEASTAFSNGTDQETNDELAERVVDRRRNPPAGGTANDWIQWCLEVSGVTEAFSYPLRRGSGTVDVVVFSLDGSGNRALPGASLSAEVEAHLGTVRPVTANYEVVTVTTVAVDITISGLVVTDGFDEATVIDAAEAALSGIFNGIVPGGTLYLTSHIDAVLTDVAGVADYVITTPVANVSSAVSSSAIEVLVAGTIGVSA